MAKYVMAISSREAGTAMAYRRINRLKTTPITAAATPIASMTQMAVEAPVRNCR